MRQQFTFRSLTAAVVFCCAPMTVALGASVESALPWTGNVVALGGKEPLVEPKEDRALILFWGSWCSVCKNALTKEIPEIERSVGSIAVIPISLDKDEERAIKALKERSVRYRSFIDSDKSLVKAWRVFAAPYWAVLRKEGGQWKKVGGMSGWSKDDAVRLLEAPNVPK